MASGINLKMMQDARWIVEVYGVAHDHVWSETYYCETEEAVSAVVAMSIAPDLASKWRQVNTTEIFDRFTRTTSSFRDWTAKHQPPSSQVNKKGTP